MEGNISKGRDSRLPEGGENLFQGIKKKRSEAEASGIQILNMSIGQPSGPALISAREAAAQAVLSGDERVHEYQDNGSLYVSDFARRFVQYHSRWWLRDCGMEGRIDFLSIPGIKPMLGLIPLACGSQSNDIIVGTTTDPGYPTPADQCDYLNVKNYALNLNPDNGFRFGAIDIQKGTDLLMVNYPHNPSGQIATEEWWKRICSYCEENRIRIFDDAAYAGLSHSEDHFTLADVAVNYPDLSWLEAYSASKLIGNGTGWRIGAMAGSPDFIGDLATIKGNADSGFVAPMAAGVIHAAENDKEGIEAHRQIYQERIKLLIGTLSPLGMKLAVNPGAGFFTLWMTPAEAFGESIKDGAHFNNLMIENTGVVGVPFGKYYIRYAVTSDIEAMKEKIAAAFKKANILYWPK